MDYGRFQREVAEKLCAVERRADEAALSALDVNAPPILIDEVVHVQVVRSSTRFMGLAGPAKVTRSLYRPVGRGNAPVVDPVALRSGAVLGEWLPATAREMAFEVRQRTSREAEASGKRLGRLPYSHASFEHVAHAVGEKYVGQHETIEHALIEAFTVPETARTVTVSLDSVPMEEPRARRVGRPSKTAPKRPITRAYRMAYCGTVHLARRAGEAIHTIRYGTMPDGELRALALSDRWDDAMDLALKQPRVCIHAVAA